MKALNEAFTRFANKAAETAGSSWAFLAAVGIIAVWAISGPLFSFSDTWQLLINTFTTLVTFLMVFLIQNTQNRDSKALHLKMDEIIHVIGPAHDELIDVEDYTVEELREMLQQYRQLARHKHSDGEDDVPNPAQRSNSPTASSQEADFQDGEELVLAGTPGANLSNNHSACR